MGQRRNQKVIYGRYFELNTEIIDINMYVVTQSHWKGNMTLEKVSATSSPPHQWNWEKEPKSSGKGNNKDKSRRKQEGGRETISPLRTQRKYTRKQKKTTETINEIFF